MPELRYDILSGSFSIIATERAKRPSDFKSAQRESPRLPERDPDCPFCPGNERMTPPEVYALRKEGYRDGPGWVVRVVPNKFPALVPKETLSETELEAVASGLGHLPENDDASMYWEVPAVGAHEVVIESPRHDATLGTHDISQMTTVLNTLRERSLVLYDQKDVKYVQVFRNWGERGGASLVHPHFQIIGLPVFPNSVAGEMARHKEYEAKTGRCLLCDLIEREAEKDLRVVSKNEHFIVLCPFASRYSFETMIVPRKHLPSFFDAGAEDMRELANVIVRHFSKYEELFSSLSYNAILHSAPPARGRKQATYHWHIHIYPRLNVEAGLELGTGVYINPTPPEFATQQFAAKGAEQDA
ncbi:MAG TPA: galactose-1-phosphate uridylyltransferase [Firmicutes bacterium]|nr:galactose-1-phosphate uridylyltransferase [Candidatus Fermentithermobacillaceae bacterium]